MILVVRQIPENDIIELHRDVLRPAPPIKMPYYPGDKPPVHLGVFLDGKLAGVVTLLVQMTELDPCRVCRVKNMVTAPWARGKGCGKALLEACEAMARNADCVHLWGNIRKAAAGFFEKFGWEYRSNELTFPDGPQFRMIRGLD